MHLMHPWEVHQLVDALQGLKQKNENTLNKTTNKQTQLLVNLTGGQDELL